MSRDIALHARISCTRCAFRYLEDGDTLRVAPIVGPSFVEVLLSASLDARRAALACLSLSILLASLGTSGANVALPTFAKVFGASFQAVQWVVVAYLLSVTALIVGVGWLGDIVGRRRLLQAGLTLFTAASLVCGLAPSLAVLIAGRAAQGVGASVMMALAMAFVRDTVPVERTGHAMGLLGTMSAVGTALGPSLGGMLITYPGWRTLFLINVPLGILALWLCARSLPDSRNVGSTRRALDFSGTALLAGSLAAFALSLTLKREHAGRVSLALLGGAAFGVTLFARQQARSRDPLLSPSLLRDRDLVTSLAANALVACVMMSTLIVGPFYLARALALPPAAMGLVMTVGPILTAIAGVPGGRLVDRVGARRSALIGLAGMIAGTALLAGLPRSSGVYGYLAAIVFLTVGYALFQAANNTAVMARASDSYRGLVAGVLSLARNIGLMTGASLMGAVFAVASGVRDITTARPESVAIGMRVTFSVAAVLVVAATVLVGASRSGRLALTSVSARSSNDTTSQFSRAGRQ